MRLFNENIKNADKCFLAAGNFTGCETIEVLKKAAYDYRKKMEIDENIFTACRIYRSVYRQLDKESKVIRGNCQNLKTRKRDDSFLSFFIFQGYVQMTAEWPFRLHLYSEKQIQRYVKYCNARKESLVHIDATGGVMRKITDQKRPMIYAAMFKDGDDTINSLPLAHALLTDHTTTSINIFLGSLVQSIRQVSKRLVRPSFFITDFSPAIINATLLAFNAENIQAHLNRCWNVIGEKYNIRQLKSSCFIHLCCCHVMHAIAKNLTDNRIDTTIRESVLYIFALLICETEMKKMYEMLSLVVHIFGNPKNGQATEDLQRLLIQNLNVDEESRSSLTDGEKYFSPGDELKEELELIDEYFQSSTAIIHQSPFNREAIRLNPSISDILDSKNTFSEIDNPIFSPNLIKIIYRWWAYLPLWTGLLVNFKDRYGNDAKSKPTVINKPIRFSNALIESYFKTMKYVTLNNKRHSRPEVIIGSLYNVIEQQMKADQFGVTHSSKGRKRKNKQSDEEEEAWNKKTKNGKRRSKYFNIIDKIKSAQFLDKRTKGKDKTKRERYNCFFY